MESSFIYNPEGYNGHAHASTLAIHDKQLYCAWYCYPVKEHQSGQIVISTYNQETKQWTKGNFPFTGEKSHSCGNPVLCSTNGKLQLFFVKLMGTYWDTAQIYCSTLTNNKWSTPEPVNVPQGIMVRHRPMNIGHNYYVPAYNEKDMTTIIYKFTDNPCSWQEYSVYNENYIQADLFSYNDREWQMYLRAAGDNRFVMKAVSSNAGSSWAVTKETELYCPLSGIAAIRLQSGNILVCNNHTQEHKRNPLSLSVSDTKGASFDYGPYHIDTAEIELSYPTLIQDDKGLIHLTYTYNRKMIKHISFTEEELMERTK